MTSVKSKEQLEGEITYHLLQEVKRLNRVVDRMDEKLEKLAIQLTATETAFKIKGGVWGLLGGAVPAGVALAYVLIK